MADESESKEAKPETNKAFSYVLAGLVLVASFIAASIPSHANSEGDGNNSQNEIARWTRVLGWWTRWMVIVGLITASILFLQTYAFIQSERASLVVGHFSFPNGLVPNKQTTMAYHIENSGKSTAKIDNVSINVKGELVYPLEYAPIVELAPTQIPAGGNEEYIYQGLNADNSPHIMTQATVDAINRSDIKYYVYGFVDYEDDFWIIGSKRSYFCFRFAPERSSLAVSAFGGCPIPHQAQK